MDDTSLEPSGDDSVATTTAPPAESTTTAAVPGAPKPGSPGLVIDDLRVGYGKNEVIHGVTIKVPVGNRVALLGANGAGKTTMPRAIGQLKPKGGSISWLGNSLGGRSPAKIVRSGAVQVPEGRHVFPNLSVQENLTIAAYRRRSGLSDRLERVFTVFPILKERHDQAAGLLSGGQQQMLALGRAIIAEPKLLLLDEMSLGLAPILVKEFYATLETLFSADLTMLIVEQNAKMALSVADYVYVLRNGEVAMEGPASRLTNRKTSCKRATSECRSTGMTHPVRVGETWISNDEPTGAGLGAYVSGMDFSADLTAAEREELRSRLFDEHLLLIFRGQTLPTDPEYVRLAQAFGDDLNGALRC